MGLNAWTTSGTIMLFYLASLQAIPTDVYEAAAIDGAGTSADVLEDHLPAAQAGALLRHRAVRVGCLKVFDQVFIVSGGAGGPNYATLTAVLYLYQAAIQDVDFGYAAAVGIALFVLIFTVTLVLRLLLGKAEVGYCGRPSSPTSGPRASPEIVRELEGASRRPRGRPAADAPRGCAGSSSTRSWSRSRYSSSRRSSGASRHR